MKHFKLFAIMAFICAAFNANAQSINNYYLYSYNHSLFNPAAAGYENKHIVSLLGRSEDRQSIYDYNSGILNYEGNIKSINSGIGAIVMVGKIRNVTGSKVGVSYNYQMRVNDRVKVRVGARPTLNSLRGNNKDSLGNSPSYFKDPDTHGNLDLGVWLDVYGFYGGISVENTFQRKDYWSYSPWRQYNLIVGRKIKIASFLQTDPSIAFNSNPIRNTFFISNNFLIKKWVFLGATYGKSFDSNPDMVRFNVGLNILDKVEVITHLYSSWENTGFPKAVGYTTFEGMIRVKI